jgi:hypothetical protein
VADKIFKVTETKYTFVQAAQRGTQGEQGIKGDTGDVTPAATAARDEAVAAKNTVVSTIATATEQAISEAIPAATAIATNAATQAQGYKTAAETAANAANIAAQSTADIAYQTVAELYADLAHAANITALITNDTTAAGSNTYTITTNFTAGATVVFDGVTFTVVASGATGNQFNVGASTTISATNLAAVMAANTTINAIYTVTASTNIITITETNGGYGDTPGTMSVTGTGAITVGTAIVSKSMGIWIKEGVSGAGRWKKSAYQPPVVDNSISTIKLINDAVTNKKVARKTIKPENLTIEPLQTMASRNLFRADKATPGYSIVAGTGEPAVNAAFSISEMIPTTVGVTYHKVSAHPWAWYDRNEKYSSGGTGSTTITAPTGTAYLRYTVLTADLAKEQLEIGTDQTGWENPYPKPQMDAFLKRINKDHLSIEVPTVTSGKNLFNPEDVIPDCYPSVTNKGVLVPLAGFYSSKLIFVKPATTYFMRYAQQVCYYNEYGVFVDGVSSAGAFTTTADTRYIRVAISASALNTQQIELGSAFTGFEAHKKYLPENVYLLPEQVEGLVNFAEPEFAIQLPSKIYLVSGESFSVYYRNIVKYSKALDKGNYYIRAQQKSGSTYSQKGVGYPYKWEYAPSGVETFDMEFRIVSLYSDTAVASKIVTFVCADAAAAVNHGRTANIITIGDSFTDGYGVTGHLYNFATTKGGGNTLNCIGLNDSGTPGVKDDAWSGRSYGWLTTSNIGYLRSDRPLSDAIWDSGWGENETYGWTTGQTYADLTSDQKLHGYTKNEFWNPATSAFDFAYFMDTYFPTYVPSGETGVHMDAFVSFMGLNDAWNPTPTALIASLADYRTKILAIADSVQEWDSNIKILLHTVTPQPDGDKFMTEYGVDFKHPDRIKWCQEIWNEMIVDYFDSDEMRARGVYVIPTAAHFDTRSSILTSTYYPDKFNPSYSEVLTSDIHPTATGAKYLADAMWMALYNLVFHS